jgi:hypothetical protein
VMQRRQMTLEPRHVTSTLVPGALAQSYTSLARATRLLAAEQTVLLSPTDVDRLLLLMALIPETGVFPGLSIFSGNDDVIGVLIKGNGGGKKRLASPGIASSSEAKFKFWGSYES